MMKHRGGTCWRLHLYYINNKLFNCLVRLHTIYYYMKTILIKCNECGIDFNKSIYEYTRKKKLGKDKFFCSLRCGSLTQIKDKEYQKKLCYEQHPKKCIYCDKNLLYENRKNKFCNQSCAAKKNNKDKIIIKDCLFCGVSFHPTNGNKVKFCSKKCSAEHVKQKTIDLIESGKYNTKSCQHSTLKKYLIMSRGHKCECCKNHMWMNEKIILTLDHIDGNATNNNLNNLKLLCWNCHSLTPTFGAKNKKGTRIYRKQRYSPVSSNDKIPSS